ncbi:MAG: tRNA lysidine(34) synthetase TilS [Dehalococcoidia bacterium]|jgi:tRNA(Ile)-lysidine synthase
MGDLEDRVLDFIRRESLLPSAGRKKTVVLVAVSGGPDSVCLLHTLHKLQASLRIKLHVAHLNHMLRGAASDGDALYVERLAKSLKTPVTIESIDVDSYRRKHKLSLEEAAREVRYGFLSRVAESVGADCVALGHTEDDQVETVLMHLVRGAGIAGLRGMLPASDMHPDGRVKLRLIRPLLEVSRKETEDYCSAHGLKPRIDATNSSLAYARNRFRNVVMPVLKKSNSDIGAAVRRVTETAADIMSFLDVELAKAWSDAVCLNPVGITINKAAVLALHSALRRHLLRRVVREALGDIVDIEAVHIEKMMEALSKPAGKKISLPRGMKFYVGYDTCLLANESADVCPLPEIKGTRRLKVPGVTLLPGWRVRADIVGHGERASGFTACIDMDAAGKQLTVRCRRPGDRFRPLGMRGTKKLQDFMVDSRIPGNWRDRVPLLCSRDGVVWVAGWRISDTVKITDSTKKILRISFDLRS